MHLGLRSVYLFFFNDTATTEIYTLSLHDALPISTLALIFERPETRPVWLSLPSFPTLPRSQPNRSEEHTSELQSPDHLVCRLLLEKKKQPAPCFPPPLPSSACPPNPHSRPRLLTP